MVDNARINEQLDEVKNDLLKKNLNPCNKYNRSIWKKNKINITKLTIKFEIEVVSI